MTRAPLLGVNSRIESAWSTFLPAINSHTSLSFCGEILTKRVRATASITNSSALRPLAPSVPPQPEQVTHPAPPPALPQLLPRPCGRPHGHGRCASARTRRAYDPPYFPCSRPG